MIAVEAFEDLEIRDGTTTQVPKWKKVKVASQGESPTSAGEVMAAYIRYTVKECTLLDSKAEMD